MYAPEEVKLLILEDDPATAQVYMEYLLGEGYTIRHVDRVEYAKEELATANFDAVLLDLNVLDSRGFDTLVAVAPITNTPIIVLTGSIGEDMAKEAKDLGATDYLHKDNVRPDIVARVISDAVNQHNKYRWGALAERLERMEGVVSAEQ